MRKRMSKIVSIFFCLFLTSCTYKLNTTFSSSYLQERGVEDLPLPALEKTASNNEGNYIYFLAEDDEYTSYLSAVVTYMQSITLKFLLSEA